MFDGDGRYWTEITGPNSFSTKAPDASWDVEVDGIVRVGPSFAGSTDCQLVFGTMVNRGTNLFAAHGSGPYMQLSVDGGYHNKASLNSCDASAAKALGYDDIDQAEVTPGTTFAFYLAFPTAEAPDHLLVGHPFAPEQQKQLPVDVVIDVDPPTTKRSAPIASNRLKEMTATDLIWEAGRGPSWAVRIDALVRFDDGCVVVAGSFTPSAAAGPTVESRDQPRFGLIADGRYVRSLSPYPCREQESEAAGYLSPQLRDLATDVAHNFFASFAIPGDAAIYAVVIGDPSNSRTIANSLALSAELLPELPAAAPTAIRGSNGLLPLAGATGTSKNGITTWEIRLSGMIETGPSSSEDYPGRCIDIYGTMAPIALENSATVGYANGASTPEIGVLQGGTYFRGLPRAACDQSDVEAAGYRSVERLGVVAGQAHPFHLTVLLPDGPVDAVVVESDGVGGFSARPDFSTEVLPPDTSWSSPRSFDGGQLAGTRYEYSDQFTDWVYELHSMVEVDVAETTTGGRCFAVLGTVTPTRVSWSGGMTEPGNAPPIAAIGGGYMYWGDEDRCDAGALEHGGYTSLRSVALVAGETGSFAAPFLIPSGVEIDVIAVGRVTGTYPDGSEAIYVVPTVSAEISPAQ